jgi:hypothetical protein
MKMKELQVVPLSKQALALLRDLHTYHGDHPLLFPSIRSVGRPISDNTVNAALRASSNLLKERAPGCLVAPGVIAAGVLPNFAKIRGWATDAYTDILLSKKCWKTGPLNRLRRS